MFVSLPNVFFRMGMAGRIVGLLFFLLAGFAALTSCISVLESIAANCMELFHTERKKTTGVLSIIYLIATAVIALGYSIFYVEVKLPNWKHRSAFGYYGLHLVTASLCLLFHCCQQFLLVG